MANNTTGGEHTALSFLLSVIDGRIRECEKDILTAKKMQDEDCMRYFTTCLSSHIKAELKKRHIEILREAVLAGDKTDASIIDLVRFSLDAATSRLLDFRIPGTSNILHNLVVSYEQEVYSELHKFYTHCHKSLQDRFGR